MASTIKVDNVQNQPGTNIVSKCGTDVTLGASGDTVALACGASQTGFGRTGTVDWITTPKVTGDSPVTGVSGSGYFLNTTAGTITLNLPAGTAGDIISLMDYAATWQTNNVTVTPNGSEKIGADSASAILDTQGQSVTFVYVDGTQGWLNTMDSTSDVRGKSYVTATGGNQPTAGGCIVCTDYKIHVFTGPGAFCVSCAGSPNGSNTVDYLVVAGGAGGGGASSGYDAGGGGGAGGFRISNTTCMPGPQTSPLVAPNSPSPAAIPVTATPYTITVGGGGTGGTASPAIRGTNGVDSTFSTITSAGGGGGGSYSAAPLYPGSDGGSGGGGTGGGPAPGTAGGSGNTPVVSPPQGNDGGLGSGPTNFYGAGGGGASAVGADGMPSGGAGGAGSYGVQTGFAVCEGTPGPVPGARYFSGGGGGGGAPSRPVTGSGAGGDGGGGGGRAGDPAGGCNTGGAGGGGDNSAGRNGGSGIVIIRYKFQ